MAHLYPPQFYCFWFSQISHSALSPELMYVQWEQVQFGPDDTGPADVKPAAPPKVALGPVNLKWR